MIEGVVANHLGLEGAILGLVVLFWLSLNFQLILSWLLPDLLTLVKRKPFLIGSFVVNRKKTFK
jgi:hypothetical protein